MKFQFLIAGAAFAALSFAAFGAQAGTVIYSGTSPEQATDSSITATYTASKAGPAALSFTINGYASLDGQNYYEDDFTLSLNSATVLSGAFNLGGGGANVVYTQPVGGSAVNISGNGTDITWAGGTVVVSEPVTLNAGLNTFVFSYASLPGPDHAGFQGLGDEGWGISNATLSGVPEPATWAMMILGLGGLGLAMRQRKVALAA